MFIERCKYILAVVIYGTIGLFLRHVTLPSEIVALCRGMIGIVLVSGAWGGSMGNVTGVLLGFAAASCFVGIVICNRKIRDIPALDKAAFQLAMSALTILPYALPSFWERQLSARA